MIVIFSHKQKFVQTESKNKFTIEPQPMFVNTLQRYEGFFILLLLQSNKLLFVALNGGKADSLRAGRTKGPSFCFFKQKITTYSIVIEAK